MRAALVAVKQVPIGAASLRVVAGELTRKGVSHGIDPSSEVALEWALRQRDAGAFDEVIAVTIGDESAIDTLRQAVALGADDAVLVPAEAEPDTRTTARLLAATATRRHAELVVLGYESLDGSSGTVPGAVAATLDRPLVSRMRDGAVQDGVLSGSRDLGAGPQTVSAALPAVVSVVEGAVTPRFPKLKQLMAARSAPITHLTPDDAGIPSSPTAVRTVSIDPVPQQETSARVVGFDEGVNELFDVLTGGAA
jgi:electron transfer flavoprotein beta subunit